MEVLFIVDKVEDIDKKIAMLDGFGAEIKFFVHSKHVAELVKNKNIVKNIAAIYNDNVNATIDNYLKSKEYKAQPTLLCYSSVELNNDIINQIRENLQLKPHTIYIKKKFGWWDKFKMWFYQKLIKGLFGMNDAYASIKMQYFSTELMEALAKTNFKNHIFSIENSLAVELEKGVEKSYYVKPKFSKNYLYNPIVICLILICYVVLEAFLKLPFWVYFLVVALLLATIINLVIMIINNAFNNRFKK